VDRTEDVAKEVDDQGDVHVQVRVNEGSGDVQDLVAEEGSAVLVQMGEEDDITYVVGHQGAIHVRVPGDDRRVAAKVPEGADTALVDEGDSIHVQTPVDEGDSIHVQTPVDAEGGANKADVDTVDDRDVMDKHVDKGGIVQDLVAEDGDVRTQDEKGGTDSIQADAGGDLTVLHRGGDAIHATVDVVGGRT
jgi:hypothetical protein